VKRGGDDSPGPRPSTGRSGRSTFALIATLLITIAALVLSAVRLRPDGDLTAMFPSGAPIDALGEYVRAFHGGGAGIVLVRGSEATRVAAAAAAVTEALRKTAELGVEDAHAATDAAPSTDRLDPTRAWVYAGPRARARLAAALTPEGMAARLAGTRALLLAPGSSDVESWLARDPLRLAAIPYEERAGSGEYRQGIGLSTGGGAPSADEGRAVLVVFHPAGNAFDSADARRITDEVHAALDGPRAAFPDVTFSVTGGHAIAAATEELLRRDLTVSGTLSFLLAASMFFVTFGRGRALVAVLPPLIAGTAWTAGICAIVWPRPSALALAFCAVVVGVGVDTGVHVYAALLDARRAGMSPREAAAEARRKTARPTLVAATAAASAFAALALSELPAMRQLGVLCAAGELLTAVAIVQMTPEIAALLERGDPPPARVPTILGLLLANPSAARAVRGLLYLALVVVVALFAWRGGPPVSESTVAIKSQAIAPLATYDEIDHLYGGGQTELVALSHGADRDAAAARADAVAEAAESRQAGGGVLGVDALTAFAPAPATQRARLAERDRLDLPAHVAALTDALRTAGFDPEACAAAIAAFAHPSETVTPLDAEAPQALIERYLEPARAGAPDGAYLAVTFIHPEEPANPDLPTLLKAADPALGLTSYAALEVRLREILSKDLPKVALVALVLVVIALRALLGKWRLVALAALVLALELVALAVFMRALHVRWHVYDALVVPVLLGITMDEAVFLLEEAGRNGARAALELQGPRVVATALTTAAGFGALLACRFEGLHDVGAVGALGSVLGLVAALGVVVAVALRPKQS
jgi:predicted exporter